MSKLSRSCSSSMSMADSPTPAPDREDRYERFVALFVAHEARLRSFLRCLLFAWDDVDEVMQETSLVAWRKFEAFEMGTNFMAWAAAIARFEALKHRRRRSQERLVFSEGVMDLIADEAGDEVEVMERERRALEQCLAKLQPAQRELLQLSYQPGVKFHEVAERAGKSVQAFYKTVQRLRASLLECISHQLGREVAS